MVPNRDTPPEPNDRPDDQAEPDGRPDPPQGPSGRRSASQDRAAKRAQLERDLKALTPEQKQQLTRVNRFVLGFGAGALAAMIGLTLPLPWPALGLVALVVSVIVGARGIVLAHRLPLTRGAVIYLSMGLGLLAMFAVYSVPLVLTWGDQWEYQQCLEQTQTIEGQDACLTEFEKATKADWKNILRQLRD
ncbi:MAG: YIP1 family protein [Bifidobacteriaceae bacterium]|jgi:hypothetical protein|nr:YIP1 family protein [Bifidobacteriaceae bacterium]